MPVCSFVFFSEKDKEKLDVSGIWSFVKILLVRKSDDPTTFWMQYENLS